MGFANASRVEGASVATNGWGRSYQSEGENSTTITGSLVSRERVVTTSNKSKS